VIYEHDSEDEIQFAGAVLERQREEHRTLRTLEALEAASKEGSVLLWGTALLLPRKTVDSVGLLDERYFAYHEDMDYCLRVMAAGLGTLVVPGAKVHHKRWRSLGPGQSPGREYLLVRNWYLFWRTYLLGRQRRTYPRRYLAWALERSMNARRAGNIVAADHILDGAWDALRGHWGPLQAKGRMPAPLRAFLSRGLLVWHPHLWLMLLAGHTTAVRREAIRRLRGSDP
jgi:GT2 family glycosyltransferase